MYTATLRCGRVLTYEARSFVPPTDELVPCLHHGYCTVHEIGTAPGNGSDQRLHRRARPRPQSELLDWLRRHPATTVHALRKQRFSLRMLAEIEKDGLVLVDLPTGKVKAHSDGHQAGVAPSGKPDT